MTSSGSGLSRSDSRAMLDVATPKSTASRGSAASSRNLVDLIPPPKAVASKKEQQELNARYRAFQALVKHLLDDDTHAPSLLLDLQRYKDEVDGDTCLEGALSHEVFPNGPPETISRIPEDYKLEMIVEKSKLTVVQLVTAKEKDSSAISDAFHFGLQMMDNLFLPPEFGVFEVARGVLTERHTDIGSRWAMMDSSWITPDGKLSFVKGCYRFLYDEDDDVAKRVQHINGDT
eukprot:8331172-Pyramimonas_sp.AAC.1